MDPAKTCTSPPALCPPAQLRCDDWWLTLTLPRWGHEGTGVTFEPFPSAGDASALLTAPANALQILFWLHRFPVR